MKGNKVENKTYLDKESNPKSSRKALQAALKYSRGMLRAEVKDKLHNLKNRGFNVTIIHSRYIPSTGRHLTYSEFLSYKNQESTS